MACMTCKLFDPEALCHTRDTPPEDTLGARNWETVLPETRPAFPEEYADLKQELESAPYGYRFAHCATASPKRCDVSINSERTSMLSGVLAIGGVGFGLVISGGLIDDGFIKPLTGYWVGMALLVPSLIACVCLAFRKIGALHQ
jgi:hypothetical protein